jgi:8-oxo-dGTP diphosphatase
MPDDDFPAANWNGIVARFLPEDVDIGANTPVYAALVFAFDGGRCAIADIEARGWCIPGGRLEEAETAEMAARREAWEEAGLTLGPLRMIGCYRLQMPEDPAPKSAPVFAAAIRARQALPDGAESRGVRLVTLEQLAELYYLWDPLIEAVCRYAFSLRASICATAGPA